MKLSEAQAVIDAAIAKANALDVQISAAVVDRVGDIITLARMDGSTKLITNIAQGKARASALLGIPSGECARHFDGLPLSSLLGLWSAGMDGIVCVPGGVPLLRDGELVGAVGASGASGTQDEEIARAGATWF